VKREHQRKKKEKVKWLAEAEICIGGRGEG